MNINFNIDEFKDIISKSRAWSEVMRKMGYDFPSGSRVALFKSIAIQNNIDYSHFLGHAYNKGRKMPSNIKIEDYFNNIRKINSYTLKNKIIENKIKEAKCETCNLTHWLDNIIKLELHHIDGNKLNNNLNNLKLLCPNCHSYTENYRGAKKYNKFKKIYVTDEQIIESVKNSYCRREALLKLGLKGFGGNYIRINQIIEKYNIHFLQKLYSQASKIDNRLNQIQSIREKFDKLYTPNPFWRTKPKPHLRKVKRPEKEILQKLLFEKPVICIGKQFGVSDNCIRKWCKWYNIELPKFPPGYWLKRGNISPV